MVEELSLPILPPPLPATHPLTRKRCLEYDPSSSSDPPLFSSDDHGVLLDPDESVQDGPRKRRYRGTWWGAEPNSRKEPFRVRTKRNFKRNMDSGVWLGSEDSQLSEGESSVLADTPRQPSGETQTPSEDNVTTSAVRRASGPCERLAETQDLPTMYAERIVQRCLEEGDECIDLSGLALPDLPPALVKSMLYMTKHPDSSQIPPSQGSYTSLRPCLSLFLSRNLLQTVPGEVFHLEHLTVLSLRNNGLTELPSAIRRLVNLVELNVGGNQLQWLPYDLLGLLGPQKKLKTLSVFPNPFFNPAEVCSASSANKSRGLYSGESLVESSPLISTATKFCNFDGSQRRESTPAEQRTRVPSLLEIALRSCGTSPQLLQMADLLSLDSPAYLPHLLQHASHVTRMGGQQCSVCHRPFIIARTEWVEWHDCIWTEADGENRSLGSMVPLLRRGCSWRCIPP